MCYLPIGVIRDGLTHPSIPDGWRWNGLVSDHCPVWAEFYCDRDYDRATGHVTVDDIFIDGKQREGWCTIAWGCCIIKLLNSNDLFQGKKGESGLNVLTVSSLSWKWKGYLFTQKLSAFNVCWCAPGQMVVRDSGFWGEAKSRCSLRNELLNVWRLLNNWPGARL